MTDFYMKPPNEKAAKRARRKGWEKAAFAPARWGKDTPTLPEPPEGWGDLHVDDKDLVDITNE